MPNSRGQHQRRARASVRRRRLFVAIMFLLVAGAAFISGAAVVVASKPPGPLTTRAPAQTLSVSCHAPSLHGQLPAMVYLPAGYRGGRKQFPVIYFLHGLPANPSSYQANAFVARQLAAAHRSAIVVAPQGARSANADREYLDWGPEENWPQAIAQDLTKCVDRRFRTIRNRTGRVLAGLSAGGYGAFNIGLRWLYRFGAVEAWSGYFTATDPQGDKVLDLGDAKANAAARAPAGSGLAGALKRWPTLLGFYIGNQDTRFLSMNQRYDAILTQNHIQHLFRVYAGAHTVALWSAQAGAWLGMALDALRRERAGRAPL